MIKGAKCTTVICMLYEVKHQNCYKYIDYAPEATLISSF